MHAPLPITRIRQGRERQLATLARAVCSLR